MKVIILTFLCALIAFTSSAKASPRVIGGSVARIGQFPFAVSLRPIKAAGSYFCGGALLNNQWIITAAHCVIDSRSITIQLGSNHLTSGDANRITVATDDYVIHPDYDPLRYDADMALVRLRMPITLTQYIQPIALPMRDLPGYAVVTTIGWGQVSDSTAGPVENLVYAVLTCLSNNDCKLTYGDQITESMVCAEGNYNEGTCIGDMGSPLIQYVNGNRATLAGVASFISGNGCEQVDPSGYIRTYPYLDWIQNVTNIG